MAEVLGTWAGLDRRIGAVRRKLLDKPGWSQRRWLSPHPMPRYPAAQAFRWSSHPQLDAHRLEFRRRALPGGGLSRRSFFR